MAIERKQIGEPLHYKGHVITAHELQPDVLMKVDGSESGLFLSIHAGQVACKKGIDETEKKRGK